MSFETDQDQISTKVIAVLRWKDTLGNTQELFLCEDDTADIGRGEDNKVHINTPLVSRTHAVVAWRNDSFVITDLGSKNGTVVNGTKLIKSHILNDNDVIVCANVKITYGLLQTAPDFTEFQKSNITLIVQKDFAQPRLKITSGQQEGREFLLPPGKILIGRATSKIKYDISLQDRAISRPQVEIEQKENCFYITDLKSVNGTFVNGELISEMIELQDGDVIEMGESTLLFRAK